MTPNPWVSAETVLRRFIAIKPCLKKQEKLQKNNLTLHLKQLKRRTKKIPKVSRRKEIIKIRTEIYGIKMKKIAKIN